MALVNFTLAPVDTVTPVLAQSSPAPFHLGFEDLLYSPDDHQDHQTEYTQSANEPFHPPSQSQQRRAKLRKRAGTTYLPPPNQFTHYPRQDDVPQNYNRQLHTQTYQQHSRLDIQIENQRVQELSPQFDNMGQYIHDPTGDYDYEQRRLAQKGLQRPYNPRYQDTSYEPATTNAPALTGRFEGNLNPNIHNFNFLSPPDTTPTQLPPRPFSETASNVGTNRQKPPDKPPSFTKVDSGSAGGKTQVHAVLDYDDEYYDDTSGSDIGQSAVTPLQGPILLKNGSVPVVPLTSYPTINNGTFYQIPILWTALSLALGYEVHGQIIRGVPCVKRNFQLYCPTAGNTYPLDKIETFIDENKALIKRMYGSFSIPNGSRVRRAPGVPDMEAGDSYFRHIRQAPNTPLPEPPAVNNTGRVDACESKTEIMTPYWALNSARKLRAIVNTMHFEQAIHQEVCSKKSTSRCSNDCGCEQKYKWHRLLAYDPSDDCAGIFMDWFLFPSCCVCRCNP